MMTIDPRLVERRKEVAEDRARRNVRRLLRFLIAASLGGFLAWLFLSPFLSAETVVVEGVRSSSANEVLETNRVTSGRPLILIRPGSVESQLVADPWVKEASVDLDWPDRVQVTIVERTPVAWVETSGGWSQRAVDGVALSGADGPDETMGQILFDTVPEEDVLDTPEVLAALEFVAALPAPLASGSIVEQRSGEIWAVVSGFDVRLGRPIEMEAKAITLVALLAKTPVKGSAINLIAPTNPAVTSP